MKWYFHVIKNYSKFSGRARRKEYWMFILINLIITFLLGIIDDIFIGQIDIGIGVLSLIYSLFILIPSIAVSVRRLHDTGRSGWWILINIVPLIGWIVFLIFTVLDSDPNENKYGQNPKNQHSK